MIPLTQTTDITYIRNTELLENIPQETITQKIERYEKKYEIPEGHILALVECETAGTASTTIQSYARYPDGSREDSWGLGQIHLPAWPEITVAQATDPDFALTFIGDHWEERHELWVICTRNHHL